PLGEVQGALAASAPAAARGVTRAYAHAVLPLLVEHGLRGSIARHVKPARGGASSYRNATIAVAAVVLLAVAYLGWQGVVRRLAPPKVRVTLSDLATSPPGEAPPAATRSSRELARRALGAAAALRCRNSGGSGFFVAPDLLVTNAHVLCRGDESIQVGLSNERTLIGQVVRRDDDVDLGLVRVAGAKAEPMPLGDVADLAAGDRVVIVGSPVGLDFTVQEGSIASLQRSANGVAYLQLDAKVSPGNSGGPVVDAQGRVVGIVSMKVSGEGVEGIGLAIPINYVYSPSLAFVAPPSEAAAASEAFRRMVARAQQGTDDGIREARADAPEEATPGDDRPLLVAGHVDRYDNLVVRVVRITDFPPPFEEITVTVWSGIDAFCTVKGDIATWTQADPSVAATGLDSRAAAALRRIAAGRTLYVGESPLRWDLCDRTKMRRGIQVELEGASPLANRLEVR
ncbi:MAG TPA: S1C family serine protease, partial [Vicinamibacteria bacterium]|nr:S1C family serine protease [Vicinamibacteria bacterium]